MKDIQPMAMMNMTLMSIMVIHICIHGIYAMIRLIWKAHGHFITRINGINTQKKTALLFVPYCIPVNMIQDSMCVTLFCFHCSL